MLLWVFFCWATLLIGTTGAQTCGCTEDTLPHPRIVLLGPAGVGKSTFGNRLFNISQHNNNQAICSEKGGWTRVETTGEDFYVAHQFGVGHGSESFTTSTSWMVGHYLGDEANPCITVIDTPGTGNTEGRDCEHGIALAEKIKRIGSVDAFILFKGTNPRFTQPMEDQIKLLVSIFGVGMWQNTITEFSFWRHDRRSILDRERSQGNLNEVTQHNNWNKEYKERFGVSQTIPSVFIDPVYDGELADNTESEIDEKNTNKLWNLVKNLTTFQCMERCQAPSGFFTGQPWLIPENTVQNKRLGDRTVITWQIWFASCDGSGTTSYNLSHVDLDNTTRMLYEHFDNNTTRSEHSSLRILNKSNEKFRTIQLIIGSTEEEHYGSYFVENSKGRSQLGGLRKIMDGEWQEWSPFSPCSKTCITGLEQPGLMQRDRTCKLPQNGGQPCQGDSTDKKTCAHRQGDDIGAFWRCPIDAKWSSWSTDWSSCSGNCKRIGESVPRRSRSRECIPEVFRGKNCSFLEEQAKKNNEPLYSEEEPCSELLSCPRAAALGSWGEWSSCAQTCYPKEQPIPQTERRRSCIEATLSLDEGLNTDVVTCSQLKEDKMYKECEIDVCPEWEGWGAWSACTVSCGTGGTLQRFRSFVPGSNGTNREPAKGDSTEEQPCPNQPSCPKNATLGTWGAWSLCTETCYHEGDAMPQTERTRSCIEATQSTDMELNSDLKNCEDLGDLKMVENCNVTACPGPSTEAAYTEESVLLITGGYGFHFHSVEVFPSTSGCSPPPLPAARAKHTTFLTSEPNPVLATCGGHALASCLVLDKSSRNWNASRMGDLTMPREFSAVATLNSVGVFIIGGNADNNSRTSNFLAAGSMQWKKGPGLLVDMKAPCAVSITPTSFLVMDGNHIHEFDADIAGPTSNNGWREAGRWPELKTTRYSWPGCAKLGQKVIIAGGVKSAEFLSSTEVLDLGSREITTGGDLATPRTYFHLATIIRGGQEKVYAVAGRGDAIERAMNTVEEWVEASSTWKAADNLPQKRTLFGAVTVARSYVCPA